MTKEQEIRLAIANALADATYSYALDKNDHECSGRHVSGVELANNILSTEPIKTWVENADKIEALLKIYEEAGGDMENIEVVKRIKPFSLKDDCREAYSCPRFFFHPDCYSCSRKDAKIIRYPRFEAMKVNKPTSSV